MQLLSKLVVVSGLVSAAASFVLPERPSLSVFPKTLHKPFPHSPPRNPLKICIVDPKATDAGPALIKAAKKCNNGGTVVFLPDVTYTINTPTDLTFLKHVDIAILGTVTFSDDVEYWQTTAFAIPYQDTHLFWKFGGTDVNIFGLGIGTIDGASDTYLSHS